VKSVPSRVTYWGFGHQRTGYFCILVAVASPDDSARLRPGLETGPTTVTQSAGSKAQLTLVGEQTVTTAPEAMRADEISRSVLFHRVIMFVVAGLLVALPFLQGDATAKWVFAAGLALYAASFSWFIAAIKRDPAQYRDGYLYPLGLVGAAAAYAGVFYCGVFSPAPAVVVLALYMNSLVGSSGYALFVYVLCAGMQAALATLVMTGVIVERGLVVPEDWALQSQFITQALIQGTLLATYMIGRLSRRSTSEAFARLEIAARDVAQRDALLHEARLELERAAWVGNPGRFTDQTLGSFKLRHILGRGAMGEVYEATHVDTGECAAVKLLHRNVLADPEHVARFAREAKAVANIRSPFVVGVLEVSLEDAAMPYMAMEQLDGHHLGVELQNRRCLPMREVIELVEQVGQGIDAAAAAGVIHRDLKPQNLFCAQTRGEASVWKILDFGVSKLADQSGVLTQGQAIGTPSYMSPEQARGQAVDRRTDVYSLGAIAYRALTGHPAFSGNDVPMILHDVVYRVPVRPSALADLSDDIDGVLAIALAKRREERYDGGRAFADAFVAAARGSLSEELRDRGARMIARYPWGRNLI